MHAPPDALLLRTRQDMRSRTGPENCVLLLEELPSLSAILNALCQLSLSVRISSLLHTPLAHSSSGDQVTENCLAHTDSCEHTFLHNTQFLSLLFQHTQRHKEWNGVEGDHHRIRHEGWREWNGRFFTVNPQICLSVKRENATSFLPPAVACS